ncbi:Helix-turn-helix [Dyadobacter soli]|uniref:Helix-turn-helix n=1 Tax=Dyadobacter soli TaxID=659014 RepID=A0A1G7SWJ5_9BACT|nr:helix-turn-helix domain-containing protein [Dyadobacter soli]SDG27242.1 Helix-turn-helix [Dyadobacter soli]
MKKEKEINPEQLSNDHRRQALLEFIIAENAKRTPEQKLKTEMLGIQYLMEDYFNDDSLRIVEFEPAEFLSIHYFIKRYLKVLNTSQKQLAELFEMKDSNLHKYLTGERKLNTDIAFKLASFTKTTPEHWLRLEIRNELKKLGGAKVAEFEKYGYEHVVNTRE